MASTIRGVSRTQQRILGEKGWIPPTQVAHILGVTVKTAYKMIKREGFDVIRVGRALYVRKTQIARWLQDQNPNHPYVPYLFGLETSGECLVCKCEIPISEDHCPKCKAVEPDQGYEPQ